MIGWNLVGVLPECQAGFHAEMWVSVISFVYGKHLAPVTRCERGVLRLRECCIGAVINSMTWLRFWRF